MSQDPSRDSFPNPQYRGRFAPSPTGPLHFGSLIAAAASYLEARSHDGIWLVRMEDVDELRNVKGAADDILFTLEAYGFEWDESVIYQTQRKQAYEEALSHLVEQDKIYRCVCSRRDLRESAEHGPFGIIYPGFCADKKHAADLEHSLRIRTEHRHIEFNDRIMGEYGHNPKQDIGDFIVRRRDGLFAYQLAVVVDDEFQQINDVVRGFDLLDSTPRQIYLQQCLGYKQPDYAHLPIAINDKGDKLSKQTFAPGIDRKHREHNLVKVLAFLGQQPEPGLEKASLDTVWQWARENWHISTVPAKHKILHP